MTSQIDITKPVYGTPTTQSVRDNFSTAATEISDLQAATTGSPFLPLGGSTMTGPMYLWNDPTDVMMPATKGYVDAHGGLGGGGGIPEAPSDGQSYGRGQGAWTPVLKLSGGTLTGLLTLSGQPSANLHAATKQYVDSVAGPGSTAVQRAGDTMTGLLTLSGDPANPLHAATKQYVDAGLALRAPIANPAFTGIVSANGGRVIITSNNAPSLTLNNTTTNSPVFGLFNTSNQLQIGLAQPATGNISGVPFATMDNAGNWNFNSRVYAAGGRLIVTSNNLPSITINNINGGGGCIGAWVPVSAQLCFGLVDPAGTPGSSPLVWFGFGSGQGSISSDYVESRTGGFWTYGINAGYMFGDTRAGNSTANAYLLYNVGGNCLLYSAAQSRDIFFWNYTGFAPRSDNQRDCGWGTEAWRNVVSYAFPNMSDRRSKREIEPLPDCLPILRRLNPQRFKWNVGRPEDLDVTHWGFVAQDVEAVMLDRGHEFGGHRIDHEQHTLAYNELVAVLWKACQEMAGRLDALEKRKR